MLDGIFIDLPLGQGGDDAARLVDLSVLANSYLALFCLSIRTGILDRVASACLASTMAKRIGEAKQDLPRY